MSFWKAVRLVPAGTSNSGWPSFFMGGIMQVTATAECFWEKDAAIGGVRVAHWSCGNVDFAGLLALYDAGHVINISDPDKSVALILDIDGPKHPSEKVLAAMSPERKEKAEKKYSEELRIHKEVNIPKLLDPAYLDEVAAKLGAKSWELRDSSSRNPLKKKLFFEIEYKRNLLNNKDLEGKRLRELFEKVTGIQSDAKMDTFTQLTFGCQITCHLPMDRSRWIPCGQPKKAASEKKERRPNPRTHAPKETPQNEGNFQFIPLNMGAYNHKYGKSERNLPRLDWMIYRYKAGGGYERNIIPAGSRHNTAIRVIYSIVINALVINDARPLPLSGEFSAFTLADCLGTLKRLVRGQFEDGESFWSDEGKEMCATMASIWEGLSAMTLPDAYALACARTGSKECRKYTPWDEDAGRIWRFHRDDLTACRTYEEVKNLCGILSQGDKRTMDALLRRCRKDPGIVRGKAGRRANKSENAYVAYLAQCPQTPNGHHIVDKKHYFNPAFRNYCNTLGLLIKKKVVE